MSLYKIKQKRAARLEVEFNDESFLDNDNMKFNSLYENWKKEYAPFYTQSINPRRL